MSIHGKIRGSLYEFAMGELSSGEQAEVQQHLDSCPACAAEYGKLQQAIGLVPRPSGLPEDERTEEFWESFSAGVERRIASRIRKFPLLDRLQDAVASLFIMRAGQIAAAGLSAAIAVLALVLVLHRPSDRGDMAAEGLKPRPAEPPAAAGSPAESTGTAERTGETAGYSPRHTLMAADRVTQYFRRSKILLIGIANMRDEPEGSLDLSAERRTSRALVKEARYLKQQSNLDPRARELIDELNRVLIELANLAVNKQAPGVEIIRGGIRQENLLFKIRMAEAALDTTRFFGNGMTKERL